MKQHARGGVSTLYHLARKGWSEVLLGHWLSVWAIGSP